MKIKNKSKILQIDNNQRTYRKQNKKIVKIINIKKKIENLKNNVKYFLIRDKIYNKQILV